MSEQPKQFSKSNFANTFILPVLLAFLIPAIGLAFFLHAEERYNSEARKALVDGVLKDAAMIPAERNQAIAFFNEHPFSELVQNEEVAKDLEFWTRFDYFAFRWLIRLSAVSIVASVGVFVFMAVCVVFSLQSQNAQYLSLSVGWQVLRIYGAVQAVIQGVVILALSYYVTALWMHSYYPKLILCAAIFAALGVGVVLKAIFKRVDIDHAVEGVVIDRTANPALWADLNAICTKVGAKPPDQVIVGIDDSFFVTEMPITASGTKCSGRTLFVSLSLLRQLHGREASAILAHEMAHFSGSDTLYSKKISPLLARYGAYLGALYQGGVTRPIFYFMHCFWALFQLSLGKLSRQREFRADKIAAETTSPRDFAGGLLRVVAFSKFRGQIQKSLFENERALEAANISEQIGAGFNDYARSFAATEKIGGLESPHPFDSHPPTVDRLAAIGASTSNEYAESLLGAAGDAQWYHLIENAAEIEQKQWSEFEAYFRKMHEESLPYRFLPSTDEERAIVVKFFPEITFPSKDGAGLVFNCEGVHLQSWPAPVQYKEITKCVMDSNKGALTIHYERNGTKKGVIRLKAFGNHKQEVVNAFNLYYSRFLNAKAYQEHKQARVAKVSS
jgi:Zn-dependent protease with chaperone function